MPTRRKKIGIIGGGPAGCSVAIQLMKYNLKPIIFEKKEICSLLKNPYLIENYLGFPCGIKGEQLRKKIMEQVKGVKVINEEVIDLNYENEEFLIKTVKNTYSFDIVVITSGTKPKEYPLKFNCDKIFYEVYPLINSSLFNKILIIGSGEIAFDSALNLSEHNKKVYLVNRTNRAKCNLRLFKSVVSDKKIKYLKNTKVVEISKNNDRLEIVLENKLKKFKVQFDAVLIAIGRIPATGFMNKNFKRILKKLVKQNKLYFAGDVKNGIYRQISIASGDGIKQGMKIYEDHFKEG